MSVTRNGKIARLPKVVRDELNRRLSDGEPGKDLVMWLNGLPQVRQILAEDFDGRDVNAQNLSDWRQGGYRDWVTQQEALELARRLGEDAAELNAKDRPPLTDTLALWLAARYAVATRRITETEGAEGWRLLRELCADIVELRRGDHSAARLKIEQARLEQEREETEEEAVAHFQRWTKNPKVREAICGRCLNPEEQAQRMRAIFGLAPVETSETVHGNGADQGESSPIKAEPDSRAPTPVNPPR